MISPVRQEVTIAYKVEASDKEDGEKAWEDISEGGSGGSGAGGCWKNSTVI